jgi:hypothetical protein
MFDALAEEDALAPSPVRECQYEGVLPARLEKYKASIEVVEGKYPA